MAVNFPSNPSNGQTITVSGITYAYDSTQGVWSDNPQGLTQAIDALTDVDTSTSAPTNGQILQWNSTDSEWQPADSSAGVTVYATIDDLPLTGVAEGSMALVDSTDKLYIFSDIGWYSISIVNQTPSISGVSATYVLATDGTATTVTVTATDPEGVPLTYSIVSDTSGNIATVTQGAGSNTNQWTITPSTNTANAGSFTLVFRASDGTNVASASSTFTLQFSVENSNYTTALITSVGANNAVNNSFDDASTNNHTITANGNVTQNTFSPYRHGGYSTYFDGSGDYLQLSASNAWGFGNGAWTVEFWIKTTVTDADAIAAFNSGSPYNGWSVRILSGLVKMFVGDGSTYEGFTTISGTTTVNDDDWHHVAVTSPSGSNTISCYVDGVLAGSHAFSIAIDSAGQILRVGADTNSSPVRLLTGYLTDVRIVKGTAVYTSAFTPPDERLSAITNTSLLTCHLPYIADGSTNDHSITVNGNTKTEAFSPYDYQGYSASNNGGSAYLDGNGDTLVLPNDSSFNLNGEFCIEFWVYLGGSSYAQTVQRVIAPNSSTYGAAPYISIGNDAGITGGPAVAGVLCATRAVTAGNPQMHANTTGTTATGTYKQIPLNQWTHCALTRDSSNVVRMWQGGVLVATNTETSAFDFTYGSTVGPRIGQSGWASQSSTTGEALTGFISDFRIVKGTAVYTSAFTPPTAPLTAITNTSLLLNGTGAGIIDKSQTVPNLKLYGDAKSSTTQSKYLSSSMAFDGTGDYIQSPYDADLFNKITFPSGVNFTVEAWIYLNTAISSSHTPLIVGAGNGIDAAPAARFNWGLYFDTAGSALNFGRYDGSTYTGYSKTNNINATTWTHVAVTRNGTDLKFFVNGTQLGTTETDSTNWSGIANYPLSIGRWYHSGNTADDLDGYLSDVRITKGLARYTSNFTPPSAALEG